jgi:hypothetical protein
MIFQSYRFENPNLGGDVVTISGWSYLWAGLFGAFYVAASKHRRQKIGKAVAINVAHVGLYIVVAAASSALPPVGQLTVIVLLAPLLVVLQGRAMIGLVKDGFRRRGWWIHRR